MRSVVTILLASSLVGEAQQNGRVCAQANRIKVVAPGRVKAVSGNRGDVAYSWVSAGDAHLKVTEQDDWCLLIATRRETPAGAELAVTLPRRIRFSKLESLSGPVTARYLDGDVEAWTPAGAVEMDEIGGNVSARTGGGAMTFGMVKGSLRCLSGGGSIKVARLGREGVLETAGGEIVVGEAGGWLRLSTSGNIRVERAAQDVFAHSAQGGIEVGESGGMVTAETSSGGIQVGKARGVRCESGGGSIQLRRVAGSVRASTAVGSLFVGLDPSQPLESSFLGTGKGDITVFVPSNLAVTVKAMNEAAGTTGGVLSEFREIQLLPVQAGRGGLSLAQGSLNGGGPALMLSAYGGTISIRRQR
ncbi:MAG: hypothetical protein HY858_16600 [Candidatus Solibacter usitatus]|nr:hypothetical protein [Candidatus Solibacter usitatus]